MGTAAAVRALRLGRELGADVQVQLTVARLPSQPFGFLRRASLWWRTASSWAPSGFPDAVAPIDVSADLRAGRVVVSTDVDAPGKAGRRPG